MIAAISHCVFIELSSMLHVRAQPQLSKSSTFNVRCKLGSIVILNGRGRLRLCEYMGPQIIADYCKYSGEIANGFQLLASSSLHDDNETYC